MLPVRQRAGARKEPRAALKRFPREMADGSQDAHAGRPVVLMTGASGQVGKVVSKALTDHFQVIGLDQPGKQADVPLIPVDLTVDASVDHALAAFRDAYGAHIASVIHLAAYYDFTGEDNSLYTSLNVDGTRRLLDRLQRFRVDQFVYSSTMLVEEAGSPGEAIDEDRPLRPRWAYPESKARAEAVIRERHGAIPYVIIRLAGLYDDRTVVPTLAHQIARIWERNIESHVYPGNRDTQQSMVHHVDVGDAVRRAVERRAELPSETVMLIGEPDPPSYEALQDRIGELLHGEHWTTVRIPELAAVGGAWLQDKVLPHLPEALGGPGHPFVRPFMVRQASDNYALDITRARELLGWEPRRRLMATLPTILDALKRDPDGWFKANNVEPAP